MTRNGLILFFAKLYRSAGVRFSAVTFTMATGTDDASSLITIGGEMSGGSAFVTVWEIESISASAAARSMPG
jgi:hypothetical protein